MHSIVPDHATAAFILAHRSDDVMRLALDAAKYPDVDMRQAIRQIEGWQKACSKLPLWAENPGIVFPPKLSMEQCSSESTARYKASVALSAVGKAGTASEGAIAGGGMFSSMADLTGGFGVDFSYISRGFSSAVYVERQQELCDIAAHNFSVLGLGNVRIECSDAVDALSRLPRQSLVYVDPARRDGHGNRVYGIEDCSPDILSLKDELLAKAGVVMVKLSPMLDWHAAVSQLGCVSEVHIVSVDNECKELLLLLSAVKSPLRVYCVNIRKGREEVFCYDMCDKKGTSLSDEKVVDSQSVEAMLDAVGNADVPSPVYLYEPNASIMKAGCFSELSSRYAVSQLDSNSHLFVSAVPIDRFPGRSFRIVAIMSLNRKELRRGLAGLDRANITVRNFPLTAVQLRKRLGLKDGGSEYLLATTYNRRHIIFRAVALTDNTQI